MRRGFTLVEVVVALVVLEVGILGVVSTLVIAAGTLRRASTLEGALWGVEEVLDSLRAAGTERVGSRAHLSGATIAWVPAGPGLVRVTFTTPDGDTLVALDGVVP